jgi:hypothetical protein
MRGDLIHCKKLLCPARHGWRSFRLRQTVLSVAAVALLLGFTGQAFAQKFSTEDPSPSLPEHGDYGGDLDLLRSFYSPPQLAGESNYVIDMQVGEPLRGFVVSHGLTNNHALFVLSHAEAVSTASGTRYALYAGKDRRAHSSRSSYSIRDIARLLGPANAARIHNLLLAGCNKDNALSLAELRFYFPNATNIVHATPRTDARESTFRHALTYHSRDLQFLSEMADTFTLGVFEAKKSSKTKPRKSVPYVAELFHPGDEKPYLTQTAGRELLQPSVPNEQVRRVRGARAPKAGSSW